MKVKCWRCESPPSRASVTLRPPLPIVPRYNRGLVRTPALCALGATPSISLCVHTAHPPSLFLTIGSGTMVAIGTFPAPGRLGTLGLCRTTVAPPRPHPALPLVAGPSCCSAWPARTKV